MGVMDIHCNLQANNITGKCVIVGLTTKKIGYTSHENIQNQVRT